MTFDQAQDSRLAQRTGPKNPGIRILELAEFPERAYKGQLIYRKDSDTLYVFDGDAWQEIGDQEYSRTYVSTSDPNLDPGNNVEPGDEWYSIVTGLLLVWNGSDWAEPELPEDSVDETALDEYAITDKHVIVAANFLTALTGPRMAISGDANGGIMKFWYDIGETLPGFINPKVDAGRPQLHLSSGTMFSNGTGSAQIQMYGAYSGGSGKKIEMNANLIVDGTVTETSSRRYKQDIENLPFSKKELLELRPVSYRRRENLKAEVGFIAEEADELTLFPWVAYNEDDEPDGFRYTAWTAALQHICREQQREIDTLKARMDALEARLDAH